VEAVFVCKGQTVFRQATFVYGRQTASKNIQEKEMKSAVVDRPDEILFVCLNNIQYLYPHKNNHV
jgi:hypothetical protein